MSADADITYLLDRLARTTEVKSQAVNRARIVGRQHITECRDQRSRRRGIEPEHVGANQRSRAERVGGIIRELAGSRICIIHPKVGDDATATKHRREDEHGIGHGLEPELIARVQYPRFRETAFCSHAPASPLIAANCAPVVVPSGAA